MRQLLPAILFAAAAVAQTPPNLLAITLAPLSGTPMLHQSVHGSCTPLGSCTTVLPPNTLNYWPGGTTWDSATNSAWATTGTLLTKQDLTTCTPSCGPVQCPRSPGSQATGLDLHDALNELWTIDSNGIITRSQNNCGLAFVASHNTGLLPGAGPTVTTAIGIDELRGLVFYSTSNFGVGSGTIYVAPIATPGAWFASFAVQDCFNGPNLITGLAVDAGNAAIYWTNGRGTFRWTYTVAAGPVVNLIPGTCCIQAAPVTEPYTDLAIKWGGATPSGTPCANGTCPACPMVHLLRNAPLLGTTLQLGLDQTPTSMPAWCVISFGACTGGGSAFPPLCAPPLVNLNATAVTLGMNITTAGTGCTGTTTFLLPLPSNPSLAGVPMSSQCIGLCPPLGTTMSNCLSWILQ
ncbi:MAG: hypothetical protein KDC98_02815 [Planctomycetes bacterium]|nr:hypothetical protein [Planctomycetota bacterium]